MNTRSLKRLVASLLTVGCSEMAVAEDIDIFSQNTTITAEAPNVLIILDSSANWDSAFGSGKKFDAEKTALTAVVSALKTQFNLGIMMYTETGGGNSSTDGGYVRFAIQGMTDSSGNATPARNCLLKMVGAGTSCTLPNSTYYTNLDISADKGNGGKIGVTMSEAYDYFAGINGYAGINKVKADYTRAFTSGLITGPQYKTPVAIGCQKNFIIVINNGNFADNQSDTTTATTQLSTAGGSTTVINPPDNGTSNNNEGDEWTRFLNKASNVKAVTYTLEVGPLTTTQGRYNTALLQSMGSQGKGGYYSAIDAATLLAALTRIFNDIQGTNSVFTSASLPLSADNSGAFTDQVYMGVFRPDSQGQPRWLGNLKQYKFAIDSNKAVILVDANGLPAAGASGFATPDAQSFWTSKDTNRGPDAAAAASTSSTTGSTGGFWYFDSKGTGETFDLPDGDWVEKGGAAEQLRLAYLGYGTGSPSRGGVGDNNDSTLNSKPARQVLTCIGACLTTSGGTVLAPVGNRATTWFEVGNSALTSNPSQFGMSNSVTVSSISSTQTVTSLAAGGTTLTVSSLVATATLVTVTTSVNHGYVSGDKVTIVGSSIAGTNGTFSVTPCGSSCKNVFTYTVSGVTAGASAAGATATHASTTANVTIAGTPHNLAAGTSVVIANANCLGSVASCPFNGTFTILASPVPTATTFSYTLPGNGVGATASGGPTAAATLARAATSTAHGYANGDSVTVAGASCSPTACSQYDGTFTISNVQTSTFDYTYSASAPLPTASISGMTATDSSAATAAVSALIRWVRGLDTKNENGFQVNGADTDVRASIHGDVIHARPVVLNFGTLGSTDNIYVFYGGNDGVFRALKGGQAATDGNEQWAFIPQEFFKQFKRLYDNTPPVLYSSTSSSLIATPTGTCDPTVTQCAKKRDYFFDGPVGSYVTRDTAGVLTKAVLYITMRRGGRFIYALDVTTPTAPKFLWKKGCPNLSNNTGCDAGFEELGQTWSQPWVALVKGHTNPVLIFGAGYDPANEDPEPPTAAGDAMGRAVYVLDAYDGTIVWSAGSPSSPATLSKSVTGMDFSVAADVLVVDRTRDGFADRVYAGDVGGNVWRLDIGDASTSNWNVWKLAALASRSAVASSRKFLFAPDVVLGANDDAFDAVVIGSGDREHPLATNGANGVVNRAYMIADTRIGTVGAALGITDTCGASVTTSCSNLFNATNDSSVPTTARGWLISLASGEKVINGPLVVAGEMIFGTNQPDTSNQTCTGNLGIAKRYDINFLTGAGALFTDTNGAFVRSEDAAGGGFLPSPVAGIVEIGGVPYTFVTDNPLNPGGVIPVVITTGKKRIRTFWHEVIE